MSGVGLARSISTRAWLDDDGYHVWISHPCVKGQSTHKLPWPQWQAMEGKLRPSFVCGVSGCGCHATPKIEPRPPEAAK